jgi:hypothetical protein
MIVVDCRHAVQVGAEVPEAENDDPAYARPWRRDLAAVAQITSRHSQDASRWWTARGGSQARTPSRAISMKSMRWHPRGYGGNRRDHDCVKREGWREQGLLAVSIDDGRLTWPERELVRQLGEKLYGLRPSDEEARHG